jgi:hypothetical protein
MNDMSIVHALSLVFCLPHSSFATWPLYGVHMYSNRSTNVRSAGRHPRHRRRLVDQRRRKDDWLLRAACATTRKGEKARTKKHE